MIGAARSALRGCLRALCSVVVVSLLFSREVWPAAAAHESQPWWEVRTAHFSILTDGDPAVVAELGLRVERFRAVFSLLMPELDLKTRQPIRVFAFGSAETYAPYESAGDLEGRTILGQLLSRGGKDVITVNLNVRGRNVAGVVFHEIVHSLVRRNFPSVPLWFHEGIAEYYSTLWIDGEHVIVGRPVARHVEWLGRAVDYRLDEVLRATSGGAENETGSVPTGFYAVSWALVHYLLSGDDEQLRRTAEFLVRLGEGDEPRSALLEVFETDEQGLGRHLLRYIQVGDFSSAALPVTRLRASPDLSVRRLSSAEALTHTGELALQLGRIENAERQFERALEIDPEQSGALAGLAVVRRLHGAAGE